MKHVLIITQDGDNHVPFVLKHLTSPVIQLDPADSLDGTELSYSFDNGRLQISYDDKPLPEIQSVWYRKPKPVWADELPVAPAYRKYSETAVTAHVRELYAHFEDAVWISDFYAIRRADCRSHQQVVAHSLGFNVPDTVTTSDVTVANRFIARYPAAIVKSLASSFPESAEGEATMFYSHRLERGRIVDLSGLQLAPSIFQQEIIPKYELRITVVGNSVFAAKVIPGSPGKDLKRDWRTGHLDDSVGFAAHALPNGLEQQCLRLVRKLGLAYGAIDIIVDKDEQPWFLEINPNGQWAFIEEATGQPIGKSIAQLLDRS